MFPLAYSVRSRSFARPPLAMKISAKEGSPMLLWSLKTAIFLTASCVTNATDPVSPGSRLSRGDNLEEGQGAARFFVVPGHWRVDL